MAENEDCSIIRLDGIGYWDDPCVIPSATNSLYTFGARSSFGKTTMPFRTSFRRTRLSANEADCPAEQTDTCILFRSMERIWVLVNWPKESGPIRTASPV